MIRRALIIDTETTGLDPAKDQVIEVGCILYSVVDATPLSSFSTLLRAPANPAFAINRIPAHSLLEAPHACDEWPLVYRLALQADVILAHRAEFDRSFVPDHIRDAQPWVCTKFDLSWPAATRVGEHLVHLALAHGIGVSHAHRALTDCDLISRLLTRVADMGNDLRAFLERGLRPKATFVAEVRFAENHLAKDAGFQWDQPTRRWLRTMAVEDANMLPFRVTQAR